MSLSKKRAAPKPPLNPDLPIVQNKENVITAEKENGKDPVKPKLSEEKLLLKVVFPDQGTEEIQVAPETSLLDLRTRLCTKYKLSAGEHKLEPLDEDGRTIQFTPSSTIVSISVKAVHLKPKAKEPVKIMPPKVVEQTVRLTLKMSASQLQVIRVRPNVPLIQLMPQILEKSGFKQADYKHLELRHPTQTTMALDTTRTIDEYKIREIFIADKRVRVESPEPEPRSTTPVSSPDKSAAKISRGGNEKTSKKIKKFFGFSKKRKTSSASSTEPTSPVLSPPIEESRQEEHANSNENNSNERDRTPKKKRPAPVKQTEPVYNETLHGQVPEKMEESPPETAEKDKPEPDETKMEEDTEDGKKKAPAPPARTSVPPPPKDGSPSAGERPSRPEKPPRRPSVERQKSPERKSDDEADGVPVAMGNGDDRGSEDGAFEIEVPLVKSAPDSPEMKREEEHVEDHEEDADRQQEDHEGDEKLSEVEEEKSSPLEEPKEMEVEDSTPSQKYEAPLSQPIVISSTEPSQPSEISPTSLSQPVVISSQPEPVEETKDQEDNESPPASPDMLVEEDQKDEEVLEEITAETLPHVQMEVPPPIEPLDTSDISPPPEEEESEDENIPPPSPDPMEEFEVLPAPGEEVPPPEVEETTYKEVVPPVKDVPVDPAQEHVSTAPFEGAAVEPVQKPSLNETEPAPLEVEEAAPPEMDEYTPPQVEEMMAYHDMGYKTEPVVMADDLMDVPEPVILPEPEMEVHDERGLEDSDNLFTTPADFDVYESNKKEDTTSLEAKALEMLKQFTLAESADEQPAQEDVGGDLPPPPADILDNLILETLDQDQKQITKEEPEEKTDEETMQEIERIKEQINLMRQKKAKKEAEEEEARKNPYTIIPETKIDATIDATKVQGKGTKTFKFVPNPHGKKKYEDYKAAPEVGINLSQRGEIKGVGIIVQERQTEVRVDTPEMSSTPEPHTPTSPKLEEPPKEVKPPKTPEVIVIEGGAKPPSPPVETPKSPISPTKPAPSQKPAGLVPKSVASVPKPIPKVTGGYVSSAMMRQPTATAPAQQPAATALYGNGEASRRSSLPNYYRRFLKMEVDAALQEEPKYSTETKTANKSPPKTPVDKQKLEAALAKKLPPKSLPIAKPTVVSNGSVTAAKTPPTIAEKPKLAHKVNELLNSPQIETLPTPPEETHPVKTPISDDTPLPPPPEEFLSEPPQKEAPDLSLPLTSTAEYQNSSPTKVTSPGRSPSIVGISAAKPFGSAGGTKFRPMSAAFKSGKAGKPTSP